MLLPIKCFPALTVKVIDGQEKFFFDSEMMNFVDDNQNQTKKRLSLLTLLQLKESENFNYKTFYGRNLRILVICWSDCPWLAVPS